MPVLAPWHQYGSTAGLCQAWIRTIPSFAAVKFLRKRCGGLCSSGGKLGLTIGALEGAYQEMGWQQGGEGAGACDGGERVGDKSCPDRRQGEVRRAPAVVHATILFQLRNLSEVTPCSLLD